MSDYIDNRKYHFFNIHSIFCTYFSYNPFLHSPPPIGNQNGNSLNLGPMYKLWIKA
jgi:hypothetical protein